MSAEASLGGLAPQGTVIWVQVAVPLVSAAGLAHSYRAPVAVSRANRVVLAGLPAVARV